MLVQDCGTMVVVGRIAVGFDFLCLLTVRVEMFALEIKVQGFCTTDSEGRKSYSKGKVIKWDIEVDSLTVDSLMKTLSKEVKWAPYQDATVWYWDRALFEDVRILSDMQLSRMFEMYKLDMRCELIVAVFDKSVCDGMHELQSPWFIPPPVCVVPPDEPIPQWTSAGVNQQKQPSCAQPEPKTSDGAFASKVVDLEEPAAEEVDASKPDMFDNEEEYVGVNDEHMYMPVPPTEPPTQPPTQPEAPNTASNDEENSAEGGIPLEAEVNDADPQELNVLHDPENPKVELGAKFPDIVSFRKAIRHWAVKEGFEFCGVRTDKTRFLAKCAAKGCPWRIHASRIFDNKTIKV